MSARRDERQEDTLRTPQRTPAGPRGPPTPGTSDQFKEIDARIAQLQRLREEAEEAAAAEGQRPDAAPAAAAGTRWADAAEPSAGAMEAETVEASEAPKEDERVEMGVVHLAFDAQLPYDKRERIDDEHILGAYYGAAIELEEVSPFPTHGFNRVGGKGPWEIVIPLAQAEKFAAHVKYVAISAEVWGGQTDHVLNVSARKIVRNISRGLNGMSEAATSAFLSKEACWAEVYFNNSYEALYLDTKDVEKGFKDLGVNVYRAFRPQVKINDDGTKRMLGPETRKNLVNVSMKPAGVPVAEFKWPAVLEVKSRDGELFSLKYKLGGNATKNLCVERYGCKRPKAECGGKCDAELTARRVNNLPSSAPPRPPAGVAAARKRTAESRDGKAVFAKKYRPSSSAGSSSSDGGPAKHHRTCEHFSAGQCARGFSCGFAHAGGPDEWRKIECKVERSNNGICKAKHNCCYGHGEGY